MKSKYQVSDVVEVVKTQDLLDLKLKCLIGNSGVVMETTEKGSYIKMLEGSEANIEWFVPNISLKMKKKFDSNKNRKRGRIKIDMEPKAYAHITVE